jgi:hypothetical protein
MNGIRTWLEAIGLSQYADAFEVNDIDMDLLGQVDDQTLKDIGISSAGHRLRIRNAISKLSPGAALHTRENVSIAVERTSAERRQLTVMFCDLVGSTTLSAQLDPEDLRTVIGAYHQCVAEAVRRFDGFLAKYMGDGVLVYFGYPRAHEDDAERAVRAGLALVEAVAGLDTAAKTRLQVRVGIATGLVVVGDRRRACAAGKRRADLSARHPARRRVHLQACVGAGRAEASYREAIATAQQQSAKLWELCAATSLARLWRDQGKRTEARKLLAPVYNWFNEGVGTPVLRRAEVLLQELAA